MCVCVKGRCRHNQCDTLGEGSYGAADLEHSLIFWLHNMIMAINISTMQYLKKPSSRVVSLSGGDTPKKGWEYGQWWNPVTTVEVVGSGTMELIIKAD